MSNNRSPDMGIGMRYLENDAPRIGEVVLIRSGPTSAFTGGYLDVAKYAGDRVFTSVDYQRNKVVHENVVEWSYLPKGALS